MRQREKNSHGHVPYLVVGICSRARAGHRTRVKGPAYGAYRTVERGFNPKCYRGAHSNHHC